MIKTAPCGCETKPLHDYTQIRKKLKSGKVIWFDDPKCVEHEGGSGFVGFMADTGEHIFSQLQIEDKNGETELLEARLDLNDALKQISVFYSKGFDFSFSNSIMRHGEDNYIQIVCE